MPENLIGFFFIMQVVGTTDPENPELVSAQAAIQKRLEEMTIQQGAITIVPIEVQLYGLGNFGG